MASYNYNFNSGDTVTAARLNDARTVSNIVDADISASAAIAGTKIAPNFGSQDVVTTGEVRLGTTSQYGAAGFTDPFVTIAQGNNATQAGISVSAWGGAGTTIPRILCARSNSSTIGTQTVVVSGSALGSVSFSGSDGTNFIEAAKIDAAVDGTPGANDMPGRLAFSTTADGASSATERMRITQAGNIGIANTSPSERLDVTGNITASGTIASQTAFRGNSSDTASAPSFSWSGDANTGMFRPSTNALALSTNSSERLRITSDGLVGINTTSPATDLHVNGTARASAYQVSSNQVVGARRTGWAAATGTATRTTFATSTVTTEQLAQRVKALIDDLTTHGLIGA